MTRDERWEQKALDVAHKILCQHYIAEIAILEAMQWAAAQVTYPDSSGFHDWTMHSGKQVTAKGEPIQSIFEKAFCHSSASARMDGLFTDDNLGKLAGHHPILLVRELAQEVLDRKVAAPPAAQVPEPVGFMYWNEPDTQRHFTQFREAIGSHWGKIVPLYAAPPAAQEREALTKLTDAVDTYTVHLMRSEGKFITEELAAATNNARKVLD